MNVRLLLTLCLVFFPTIVEGQDVWIKRPHERDTILEMRFDMRGNKLVTLATDNKMTVWNVDDRKPLHTSEFKYPMHRPGFIQFSPTGESLFYTCRLNAPVASPPGVGPLPRDERSPPSWEVHEHEIATGKDVVLMNEKAGDTPVAFFPNQHKIILYGEARAPKGEMAYTLKTLNLKTKEARTTKWNDPIRVLGFSRDGKRVALYFGTIYVEEGPIRIVDLETEKTLFEFKNQCPYRAFVFLPDGNRFVMHPTFRTFDGPRLLLGDTEQKKSVKTPPLDMNGGDLQSISHDGRYVALTGSRFLGLWDTKAEKVHGMTGNHPARWVRAAFAPDGSYMLAADANGDIYKLKLPVAR